MKNSEILKQLQSTTKRLEKEAILTKAWEAGHKDFFAGIKLANDGLITFGVRQVPIKESNDGKEWLTFSHFINLAKDLQTRQFTGHAARDVLISNMNACDKDEWNNFYRLILIKDLKAGFSESTSNKVLKKYKEDAAEYMVPEYPYQRCCLPKNTDIKKFSWAKGVLSQIKSDGMFVNFNHNIDGSVDILSRPGKLFPLDEFTSMVSDIQAHTPRGTQTHGEFLVEIDGKIAAREIGNGILNSISQGEKFESNQRPIVVLWDQIPLSSAVKKGEYKVPYSERLKVVEELVSKTGDNIQLVETRVVYSMEEAIAHYKELVKAGKEGTIIKEPSAPWKDGTSKLQVKLKLEVEVDLEIVGFNPGNGKNERLFGSIQTKTSDGLLEVNVSGFEDDFREDIWNRREQLVGTIMTVTGNLLMTPSNEDKLHSLFLPRFKEFRLDKTVADDLQKVKDMFESAIQ